MQGMLLSQDLAIKRVLQGTPYDFPWVDAGSIYGALEQFFVTDQAVARIQKQATKYLVWQIAQRSDQVTPRSLWIQ